MSRQKILDTAIGLFTEEGYDKVSMREIAEAAGMTKPALYYHFNSKEDFVRTYLQEFIDHQQEMLDWVEKANNVTAMDFVARMAEFAKEVSPETVGFIHRNHRIVKQIINEDFDEEQNGGKVLANIVAKEWGLKKPDLTVEIRTRIVLASLFSVAAHVQAAHQDDAVYDEVVDAARVLLAKPGS